MEALIDSAGGVAELRTVAARLDLELGERIRRRRTLKLAPFKKSTAFELLSTPSSTKLFCSARWPLALKSPLP